MLTLHELTTVNKLPHAFILTANETELLQDSLKFVKFFLCAQPENGFACETCKVCKLLGTDSLPDFMLIEPEASGNSKVIKIEQIRKLIEFVQVRPQFAKFKVVLLSEADVLNVQAANALLMTLEEPPLNAHIILLAKNPKLLIDTILSRCPVFDISRSKKSLNFNNSLTESLLFDLYSLFILQEVDFVTTINKWIKNNDKELLTSLWVLLVEIILYYFKPSRNCNNLDVEKIAKISNLQDLQQIWLILDKVVEVRKEVLFGRQINVQLVLDNIMINWFKVVRNVRDNK